MMNGYTRIRMIILVTVALCGPIYSQHDGKAETPESTAWKEVVAKDTLPAYAKFIGQYPDSGMKQQVRIASERLIRQAVQREIKRNNAQVSRKGFEGTDVVPIGNWLGPSARFTIVAGELPLYDSTFVILCDPTAPLVFTGVGTEERTVLKSLPYTYAKVVSGRGVVIQHTSKETYVYVFGIDVSSVVTKWTDWK